MGEWIHEVSAGPHFTVPTRQGTALVFGKGTTVSVSSSKYLVISDIMFVLILLAYIAQAD